MKQLVVALSAPQKPYHPSPVQDSKGAVSEAYCPDVRCTPQAGMRKNVAAAQCSGSAWQKFRHRLGGGGGGARVDVHFVLMLIQVGKEPSL